MTDAGRCPVTVASLAQALTREAGPVVLDVRDGD
jgi:hypothetical protein